MVFLVASFFGPNEKSLKGSNLFESFLNVEIHINNEKRKKLFLKMDIMSTTIQLDLLHSLK